jgi:hypothetical protein
LFLDGTFEFIAAFAEIGEKLIGLDAGVGPHVRTSMVVRKPSNGTSTTRPCSVCLGENAMEWKNPVSRSEMPRLASQHLSSTRPAGERGES